MVWCRKEELYNTTLQIKNNSKLWFDVEKKNYTTRRAHNCNNARLWFDVEKKNYTTAANCFMVSIWLWFDVEKKNYTTNKELAKVSSSCGLM